ncbi:MAG: phosphatase domain-containing protein [Bdellovibrionota bacterium]|nr:phosphatase domain-containing protein [Bdellovibrionota bacterium]
MIKYLAVLVLLAELAFAHSILITDVDDTLKDSRVRDRVQLILRGPRTGPEMVVGEMNEALWLLVYQEEIKEVFYVSKIPAILRRLHDKFLERNYFPPGLLFGRDSLGSFKENQVKEIIDLEKPSKVVLVGDNGEADPQIYKRIVDSYRGSGIEFEVRIRLAYSDNYFLEEGQIGFTEKDDFIASFKNPKGDVDNLIVKAFRRIKKACRISLTPDI